jgi:hypothetical protein
VIICKNRNHRGYKAIRKPTADCAACREMYRLAQQERAKGK